MNFNLKRTNLLYNCLSYWKNIQFLQKTNE